MKNTKYNLETLPPEFKTHMEFYLNIPKSIRDKSDDDTMYSMEVGDQQINYTAQYLKAKVLDEISPYLLTEEEANALLADLVRRQQVMGILDGPTLADQNTYEKLINLFKAGAGKLVK